MLSVTACCSDDFKESMFPDAHNWAAGHIGTVYVFTRGPPLCEDHHFVTHGTPLSVAYTIIRDGIRVGSGEHSKNGKPMHGVFCMDGGPARNRITHARDRSTSNRCLEFQKNMWPTTWTVPCVLAWEPWPDTVVSPLEEFSDGCWKSCIAGNIDTQRDMPYKMSLIINYGELASYKVLQEIQPKAQLYMICGGKQWWGEDWTDQRNLTYWADDMNNMAASCGRCILDSSLQTSAWRKSRKGKVWYCPSCKANCNLQLNVGSSGFWSE